MKKSTPFKAQPFLSARNWRDAMNRLAPAFSTPISTSSTPPPPGPHGGVLLDSSLHGELYRLPDELHSLDPADLKEWGCEAALALLHTSSPGTTWVYLDGSARALGYGSAATLFFPNGS